MRHVIVGVSLLCVLIGISKIVRAEPVKWHNKASGKAAAAKAEAAKPDVAKPEPAKPEAAAPPPLDRTSALAAATKAKQAKTTAATLVDDLKKRGASGELTIMSLRAAGYPNKDLATALRAYGKVEVSEAALLFKAAELNTLEISKALSESLSATPTEVAKGLAALSLKPREQALALKQAGAKPADVATALMAQKLPVDEVFRSLMAAGCAASDAALALRTQAAPVWEVVAALKSLQLT
ncbi:MAG: hypothetical protein RL701_5150, partial [Pseudomonadota bacterium]